MKKILFICTGNTCRSPMAEGILKDLLGSLDIRDIQVASAGIAVFQEEGAHPSAIEALKEMNLDISSHRSQQVDESLLHRSDLILTMTQSHKEQILIVLPELKGKIFTLLEFANEGEGKSIDIPDPFALPIEEYRRTAQEIRRALEKALPKIIKFFLQ